MTRRSITAGDEEGEGTFEEGPGSGVLPAIELAMEHVNHDPDILKDYQLEMIWDDSQVCHFVLAVFDATFADVTVHGDIMVQLNLTLTTL